MSDKEKMCFEGKINVLFEKLDTLKYGRMGANYDFKKHLIKRLEQKY